MPRLKHRITRGVSFAIWCLFMQQLITQSFVFGSLLGHWDYAYWADVTSSLLVVAASLSGALTLLYWFGEQSGERFRGGLIAVWVAVGVVVPLSAFALAPTTLARIVENDACTSFYNAARAHAPLELLANFASLVRVLPAHSATNMPGKTLLYAALLPLTEDATHAAWLTLALSALGGLAVYAFARRWFRDRRAAYLALVLFMVLPSRVNFAPVPNSISPALVFLVLYLVLVYVDTRRDWLLLVLGVSVYILLVFEPLPLVLGLLFVGVVIQRWLEGLLPARSLWKLAVLPVLAFASTFFLVKLSLGFDAFQAFEYIYRDAVDFNQRAYRPYLRWIVENLIEFAVGLGSFTAIVLVFASIQLGRDLWLEVRSEGLIEAVRRLLLSRTNNLLLSFLLTFVILDVWGVNRGEVTRLWIFLSVVGQLAAAGYCRERLDSTTARLMVATAIVQAVVSTATVAFSPC